MRLAGIDLNLLTSLDAVLETHNLTVAARKLGLTQPAVSHALKRLRELLGDPLLIRTKRGMTPTPRALELRPAVRAALDAAAVVLQAAPPFDPATSQRAFTVALPDQTAFQLLPPLANELAAAPGIRIDVRPLQHDRLAEELGRDLDLAISVFRDVPAGVRDQRLFDEEFVCVMRKGSPATRGTFDLARYLACRHVMIAPRGLIGSPLDDLLAKRGHARDLAMLVPHFLVAPHVVASTDLVWTAPQRLARAFAEQLPLTLREVPFKVPGFTLRMRWHMRLDRDPGVTWLRQTLERVAPRAP